MIGSEEAVPDENQVRQVLAGLRGLKWEDIKRSEPEDLVPQLEEYYCVLRKMLAPNTSDREGLIYFMDSGEIILPGDNEVSVSADRRSPKRVIIPVVDGLIVNDGGEKEYRFSIEERAKGGSQLAMRKADGDPFRKRVVHDAEKFDRGRKMVINSFDLEKIFEGENMMRQSSTRPLLEKEVITESSVTGEKGGKNFVFSNARIDELKGGVLELVCWGNVGIRRETQ